MSLNAPRLGYYAKLVPVLEFFGWLPKASSAGGRHVNFIFMIALDLFVVVTSARGAVEGVSRLLHYFSSLARHVLIGVAHLGMYYVGGKPLSASLRTQEFLLPNLRPLVFAMLSAVEEALDLTLLYRRWHYVHDADAVEFKRICIMFQRLPAALSVIAIASFPEKLRQDLVRTQMALEAGNLPLAQRLYAGFWTDFRHGRNWYNVVATAHFIIAVGRIPIGIYMLSHWALIDLRKFEVSCLYAYALIDAFQMMLWIMPAIALRRTHGKVMRAAVEAASQQTEHATEFATMLATLHPLVGMKMLGLLVTWRLVTQVTTVASLALTGLRLMLGEEQPASAD